MYYYKLKVISVPSRFISFSFLDINVYIWSIQYFKYYIFRYFVFYPDRPVSLLCVPSRPSRFGIRGRIRWFGWSGEIASWRRIISIATRSHLSISRGFGGFGGFGAPCLNLAAQAQASISTRVSNNGARQKIKRWKRGREEFNLALSTIHPKSCHFFLGTVQRNKRQ